MNHDIADATTAEARSTVRAPTLQAAPSVIAVQGLTKRYASGFEALKRIDLDIQRGEIFALLGPNGAGKTTLISIICGLVNASDGQVRVNGHDIVTDYRAAREQIGLVPQELTSDAFATVWNTVSFSRGLFGKRADAAHIERVLRSLSLWDKRRNKMITLSGGMKRRVLIAQALVHKPPVVILDEPTAGVDVELRRTLWRFMRDLHAKGTTVVLTTHYLEEAQEMCERIAIVDKGRLRIVETTEGLLNRHPFRFLTLKLADGAAMPAHLAELVTSVKGDALELKLDRERHPIASVFAGLKAAGIEIADVSTREPDLEDIFVELTAKPAPGVVS